jgi:hypothetical protein
MNNDKNWFKNSLNEKENHKLEKLPNSSLIEVGKLYKFNYNPKLEEELDFYDAYPLMLNLGQTSTHILGLNFHHFPPKIAKYIMKIILDGYKNHIKKETNNLKKNAFFIMQKGIPINYKILNRMFSSTNVSFSIRSYIKTRINNVVGCSFETWTDVLELDDAKMVKKSKEQVWSLYYNSLKK